MNLKLLVLLHINVGGHTIIYYAVKRITVNTLPSIIASNSSYSIGRGGIESNPNVYILNSPALLANTYISVELLLSHNEFKSEKTYAALADDGTYMGYPEGDTPNETIETLDIPTNNIFIWTMPYYESVPDPEPDPGSGSFPNYDRFTIVNQSAGSYNFDSDF